MKKNESENPLAPCLMEDLRALDDLEEANVSPGFRARWRAALPRRSVRIPQGVLAAAAVLMLVLGGAVLQRTGGIPGLRSTPEREMRQAVLSRTASDDPGRSAMEDEAQAAQGSNSATGIAPQGTSLPAQSIALQEEMFEDGESAAADDEFILTEDAEEAMYSVPEEAYFALSEDALPDDAEAEPEDQAYAAEQAVGEEPESIPAEETPSSSDNPHSVLRAAAAVCMIAGALLLLCLGIRKIRR